MAEAECSERDDACFVLFDLLCVLFVSLCVDAIIIKSSSLQKKKKGEDGGD